jgi:hypothetical protein
MPLNSLAVLEPKAQSIENLVLLNSAAYIDADVKVPSDVKSAVLKTTLPVRLILGAVLIGTGASRPKKPLVVVNVPKI